MSVFVDHVGLKGVADAPTSGLFLNSLPGISTKAIVSLNESDFEAVSDAWNDIQTRSNALIVADISARVTPELDRLNTTLDDFIAGNVNVLQLAFLYKLGVEFCSERQYSDRINKYTLFNKDAAEAMRADFEQKYNDLLGRTLDTLLQQSTHSGAVKITRRTYLP